MDNEKNEKNEKNELINTVKDWLSLDNEIKQLQKEQINWLENKLKQNNNIKIVHGHYPIFTMGVYQRCKELSKILIPIFKKYNVQYYISGHEHNIQFLS